MTIRFIAFLCVSLCALGTKAQEQKFSNARISVHVIDEQGNPVVGAKGGGAFEVPKRSGSGTESVFIEGITDAFGNLTSSGRTSNGHVSFGARADGFYETSNLKFIFETQAKGRWLPWNPRLEVRLRRILNPIPMYARAASVEIPVADQIVAFDLTKGDWIAPWGKGVRSDLTMRLTRRFSNWEDFEVAVEVGFGGIADGVCPTIVPTKSTQGSKLRLPHHALEVGYLNRIRCSLQRALGKPSIQSEKEGMNYFLRVRSTTDANGRLVSANYGKIHGDFRLDPINSETCLVLFTYYLNPTANDRNVEFDPSRNLFPEQVGEVKVRAP